MVAPVARGSHRRRVRIAVGNRQARLRQFREFQTTVRRSRHALERTATPRLATGLAALFRKLGDTLERRWEGKALTAFHLDDEVDFAAHVRELGLLLNRQAVSTAGTAYEDIASFGLVDIRADLRTPGIGRIIERIGRQVKDINAETRATLQGIVQRGTEGGSSPATIARELIDTLHTWGGGKDGTGVAHSRAMVIARTETAYAYNYAAANTYRDADVQWVTCLDSPDCGWDGHDDAELADGTQRSLDEMEAFPLSHPNCVRAFAPVPFGLEEAPSVMTDFQPPEPVEPEIEQPPIAVAQYDQPEDFADKLQGAYSNSVTWRSDGELEKIAQLQGFNGTPHVVNQSELEQFIARGEVQFFRGTRGSATGDYLREGEYYGGGGLWGNGTYVAPAGRGLGRVAGTYEVGEGYRGSQVAFQFAGSDLDAGSLVTGTIRADAKIIHWDDLMVEWEEYLTSKGATLNPGEQRELRNGIIGRTGAQGVSGYGTGVPHEALDPGRFAAMRGYDGIFIPASDRIGLQELGDQYVMLNRTALRVRDSNLTEAEYQAYFAEAKALGREADLLEDRADPGR